jgi:hypothetical protein
MAARRKPFVPRLEVLEDRCVPTLTPTDCGMTVYSSVTQTHWLADADLAQTKSFCVDHINPDGSMTLSQAKAWVAGMNAYHDGQGYLGHTNWTLPGNFVGAGFDPTAGDMENLFYNEFHGYAGESISDIIPPYFHNFQPFLYWYRGTKSAGGEQFSFGNGFQGTSREKEALYVIPEYSDNQPRGTQAPDSIDWVGPPPPNFPPVSNSLVFSPDRTIIYDQALDISWLGDANLAAQKTFGIQQGINPNPTDQNYININPDGSMNYATAVAWIKAMNDRNYLGHNNWRLPMATKTDTTADYYITGSGIGDEFQGSEMGELYYTELGVPAGSNIVFPTNATEYPFKHFQPYLYWAGTQTAAHHSHGNGHSTFSFGNGFQGANINTNQLYVIPVFDGTRTVTNTKDDGFGSLRSVIRAAHAGDTIDLSGLSGKTIALNTPISIKDDNEGQYESLDIEGPAAANLAANVAISGNNVTGLFDIGPAPSEAAMTTIANVILENGQAQEGGAILDRGAPLTLRSDNFIDDQAVTAANAQAPALGGALAVLGRTGTGMTVTINNCQFTSDAAIGLGSIINTGLAEGGAIYVNAHNSSGFTLFVTGTTFSSDFARGADGTNGVVSGITDVPTDGGSGDGGAVYLAADQASLPSFSFSSDTFADCSALGGRGGKGAADVHGQSGANGGEGQGGAIFYTGGLATAPYLSVASSSFQSNSAVAGNGGAGGDATTPAGAGGAGGSGGDSFGGAVFVNFANSIGGTVGFQGDTFSFNASQGGNGGKGGSGGHAGTGRAGGNGGLAGGGALAVIVSGQSPGTALTVAQSGIDWNTANGGNGGAGGSGQVGGNGGDGAGARGAGLYLNSFGANDADIWTFTAAVLEHNNGYSGHGGNGGPGSRTGGDGGSSLTSEGGGIYDAFAGTLDLYQCRVKFNDLFDGLGGTGGDSPGTPGADGQARPSIAGGLFIGSHATARATTDTVLADNLADEHPDVNRPLGTI